MKEILFQRKIPVTRQVDVFIAGWQPPLLRRVWAQAFFLPKNTRALVVLQRCLLYRPLCAFQMV